MNESKFEKINNEKKEELKNIEVFPKKSERKVLGKPAYRVFVDCFKDNLKNEDILKFSEAAQYIVDQIKAGNKEVLDDWFVSRTIIVDEPGESRKAHIFPEGRSDLFIDKRAERKTKEKLVTFLEGVGGVDYQMSDWITDEKVLKMARPESLAYYGGLVETSVSDKELLLGLMDGNEKLAEEFDTLVKPDLTMLHTVAGGAEGTFVTHMIGLRDNKVFPFFADDAFRFLVNKKETE